MNVKPDDERKTMRMKLKLNSKEYDKLKRYTQESGLRSMSQYMLNSIIATFAERDYGCKFIKRDLTSVIGMDILHDYL